MLQHGAFSKSRRNDISISTRLRPASSRNEKRSSRSSLPRNPLYREQNQKERRRAEIRKRVEICFYRYGQVKKFVNVDNIYFKALCDCYRLWFGPCVLFHNIFCVAAIRLYQIKRINIFKLLFFRNCRAYEKGLNTQKEF